MRVLLFMIILAAAGWSGYWYFGATAAERTVLSWIEARRDEGWKMGYADLGIRGFPNRFDLTVRDIDLTGAGYVWQAPWLKVFALSYQPNHVIAIWPQNQWIETPLGGYNLQNERLRASLVVAPGTELAVKRLRASGQALRLTPPSGEPRLIQALNFAAERMEGGAAQYHLGLSAAAVTLPRTLRARLDPAGSLPHRLEEFRADLAVRYDRPWTLRTPGPVPRAHDIEIRQVEAHWGNVELRAQGALVADMEGRWNGDLTVTAQNWQTLMEMALSIGWLPAENASTIRAALLSLDKVDGNPDGLKLPLTIREGHAYFGSIALGGSFRVQSL